MGDQNAVSSSRYARESGGVNKMSRHVQTTTCKNSRNRQRPTTCHRSIDRICTQTRKSVVPGIRSKRKERMEMGGLGFALAFYSTGRVFFSLFFFCLLSFFHSCFLFVFFLNESGETFVLWPWWQKIPPLQKLVCTHLGHLAGEWAAEESNGINNRL